MITVDFVPYKEALELKALGFDETCFAVSKNHTIEANDDEYLPTVKIPLFSQAFRWFREKHNTLVTIYSNASGYLFEWHDSIGGTHRGWSEYDGPNDSGVWDSYEEAELACLRKLIEIVKSKQ